MELKITAVSDTHLSHRKLEIPECDILIHSGDALGWGTQQELEDFLDWLINQPAKHKIYVPGNHDWEFDGGKQGNYQYQKQTQVLINTSTKVFDANVFGFPYTYDPGVDHFKWCYNLTEGMENEIYNIPLCDILVTHGPPYEVLDKSWNQRFGNQTLKWKVGQIKPKIHIFGHVHTQGWIPKEWDDGKVTHFINAAMCDGGNKLVRKPVVFNWDSELNELEFI